MEYPRKRFRHRKAVIFDTSEPIVKRDRIHQKDADNKY